MPTEAVAPLGVWEAFHCFCCNLQSLLPLGADAPDVSAGGDEEDDGFAVD